MIKPKSDRKLLRPVPPAQEQKVSCSELPGYLSGTWKRSLEWREFSPNFEHKRTSNTIVEITKSGGAQPSAHAPAMISRLCWRFGRTLQPEKLRFGYIMELTPDTDPDAGVVHLQWQFGGQQCKGQYHATTSTLTLNFHLKNSTVTFTYRIVSHDVMVVCIIDVDNEHVPTIQYGMMCRVNPGKYLNA